MTDGPFSPARRDLGPRGLYVHIPFCQTKCPYCDFNTYSRIEELIPRYVDALRREIGLWGGLLGHPTIQTVFFGGGTPSYLPTDDPGRVLTAIRESFALADGAEVSLEANPGDLTPARLAAYRESGFNRLSIGVQSLDGRLLELLGRRHTAADALSSFRAAIDSGFDNVSIDLMYGLPHQTLEVWRQTLEGAVALDPPHLSMYCLTLEKGTPLSTWVEVGKVPEPDADLAADMYEMAQEVMEGTGYRHYEISNWAMSGYPSRHNLIYWRNEPFLGVGPGAHSYLGGFEGGSGGGSRFWNLKSPRDYVEKLQTPSSSLDGRSATLEELIKAVPVVESVEAIDRRLEMAETLMMGLRLDTGVAFDAFSRRFGQTPAEAYPTVVAELIDVGLLEDSCDVLKLTRRGRMLGNEVFSRFFGPARTSG